MIYHQINKILANDVGEEISKLTGFFYNTDGPWNYVDKGNRFSISCEPYSYHKQLTGESQFALLIDLIKKENEHIHSVEDLLKNKKIKDDRYPDHYILDIGSCLYLLNYLDILPDGEYLYYHSW